VVEIPIPKSEFGSDFIAVIHRGRVVDLLLASGRRSVHGYLWGELERVQEYVDHFEPANETLKLTDIEVKHGNNVYVVRLEDGLPRILIPAISTDVELGDSYLSAGEQEQILTLALNSMPSDRTVETALGHEREGETLRSTTATISDAKVSTGLRHRSGRGIWATGGVRAPNAGLRHKFEQCRSAAKRIIEFVLGPKTPRLSTKKELAQGESSAGLKTERDTPVIQPADGISSLPRTSLPTERKVADEMDFVPEGKQPPQVGSTPHHRSPHG
jgi:hypothetical protein